ncbi:MAG: mechanosensitive ion channel family protein [Bacillota bacterium]
MDLAFLYNAIIASGAKVLLALLALFIGLRVICFIANTISNWLVKADFDPTLHPFMVNAVRISLQVLLVISIASMLGIAMTSFIAVIGAAAFAVGLALQGSLANFAGGVLILLLKPFKVGDYIDAGGQSGTVKEIQLFYTYLDTPDNRRIIVPNAVLSNTSATNYSVNPTRRIDFVFNVGYNDNISQVKLILREIADKHPLIFDDPEPQVVLAEHGDSAVIFYLRVWCARENYWNIYFEIQEKVKVVFDQSGITIPYPQTEVHLNQK